MDKLEWLFKLVDGMSKPAEKIDRAMNDVATEISKVEKKMRDLDTQAKKTALEKVTDPLKKQRLELQLSREALRQKKEAMLAATKAEKSFSFESAISAFKAGALGFAIFKVADFAMSAAGAVVRLTMKIADLGLGFARAGIDAAGFRRQMRRGLEIATGSKAGGDRALSDSMFFAEKLSVPVEDMQKRWLELLQGGFSEKEVPVLVQMIEDIASAGQADKVDNITMAIRQIKAKGRLQAEELVSQLADAGLNVGDVYKFLAKELKTDEQGALKAISAGKVGADLGIFAIAKVAAKTFSKGGVIGATALEAAQDIKKLEEKLANRPKLFLGSLDGSAGLNTYQKFLSNLERATDPTGKFGRGMIGRLRDIFDRGFNSIFGGFTGQDGMRKIETALNATLGLVDRLVVGGRVLAGFFSGFVEGSGLSKLIDDLGDGLSKNLDERQIQAAISNFRELGKSFGESAKGLTALLKALGTVGELFVEKELSKDSKANQVAFVASANSMGGMLMDGFTGGMWSRLKPLKDTFGHLMVDMPQETTEKGNQMHSPSRVFMRYGQHVADGFAIGVNQGSGGATQAITDLSAARPAQTSARFGSRSITVQFGDIHISGGPALDASSIASRLRELATSAVADALEQLALEQGAA